MASSPFMKETGPAARGDRLSGGAHGGQVGAGPGAVLEEVALDSGQLQDRLHGVFDGEDEGPGALRALLDADVVPDRRVEAGGLVEKDVDQLRLERLGVLLAGEIVPLAAPARDRARDPAHHLPHAALPRAARKAAEVLGRDDPHGVVRPEGRHLGPRFAPSVPGIPGLPGHSREWISSGKSVEALETQAPRGGLRDCRKPGKAGGLFSGDRL
jgi:hypothetical protein